MPQRKKTAAMFRTSFSRTVTCAAALAVLASTAAAFVAPPSTCLTMTRKCNDVATKATPPLPATSYRRRLLPSDGRRRLRPAPLSSSIAPPLTIINTFLRGYALYSTAVDIYARWVVRRMKTRADDARGGGAVPTANELRETVSGTSGLVERPSDRAAWNRWLSSAAAAVSGEDGGGGGGASTLPRPGEYRFAYRDYVNYEERWAICKALKSVHWFLFRQTGKGTMRIEGLGGKDVTMKERFRLLTVIPTEVTWHGTIRDISSPYESKPRNCVVWDRTEMRIGFPFFRTVDSPPLAEKLRRQPWKIVKVSGGRGALLGFKRGSIGCLAYDEV